MDEGGVRSRHCCSKFLVAMWIVNRFLSVLFVVCVFLSKKVSEKALTRLSEKHPHFHWLVLKGKRAIEIIRRSIFRLHVCELTIKRDVHVFFTNLR